MLEVRCHADARAFLERAETWLSASEMENGVALASARHARTDDSRYQKPVYWATIEEQGELLGCAFRTPPYLLGVTALPDQALAPLIASVDEVYAQLPGVSGPEPTASRFAAAWAEARDLRWKIDAAHRLYALGMPAEPANAPAGRLRIATDGDAALTHAWGAAFIREAGVKHLDATFFLELLRARQLYLWDDGEPRALAAPIRHTATGAAIGVLYTPLPSRGRGYGKAAIAALGRVLQERGVRDLYLYADPANKAAGAIAEKLGYRPIADTVDIAFG